MLVTSVTVVAFAAAACGNGGGSGPTVPPGGNLPTSDGTTTSAPTAGGGTHIAVTETEFSIRLPSSNLTPGSYTFAVENTGNAPHDLVIKGPGVDSVRTQVLEKGAKGEVTVALQPGTYEVWCSVGNHRSRGMETTITVG